MYCDMLYMTPGLKMGVAAAAAAAAAAAVDDDVCGGIRKEDIGGGGGGWESAPDVGLIDGCPLPACCCC